MTAKKSKNIEIKSPELFRLLCDHGQQTLKQLGLIFDIQIGARGNELYLSGESGHLRLAFDFFTQVSKLHAKGKELSKEDILISAQALNKNPGSDLYTFFAETIFRPKTGHAQVAPKGPGQRHYAMAMRDFDLVFGIGPAGTGKTYLAVASAVASLLSEQVSRIVLTRPAVEAGERLGFLPGSLEEKVLPYLRPLYDALFDLLGQDKVEDLVEKGVIEVAPIAFMRGRTLNDAFVILDEAQNTTPEQMKMFLTRLGFHSKMVVTGDVTQIDLKRDQTSGLVHTLQVLKNVPQIAICHLTEQDVVRHPLVQVIIQAYGVDL